MPIRFFDLTARPYDFLTAQPHWQEQIGRVLAYAPRREGMRALDLGCGPGVSSFVLAERLGPAARVVGIDLARNMIDRARRHHRRSYPHLPGVSFHEADAAHLPFAAARFDLAVGHSFLYLVADRLGVLREVRRVLVPGGTLVLMEPNAEGSIVHAAIGALSSAGKAVRRPIAAARFAASMVAWRIVCAAAGPLSPPVADRLFRTAGFREVACHPTLGGLGLHCVGRA